MRDLLTAFVWLTAFNLGACLYLLYIKVCNFKQFKQKDLKWQSIPLKTKTRNL
jgi:hypothetical protein